MRAYLDQQYAIIYNPSSSDEAKAIASKKINHMIRTRSLSSSSEEFLDYFSKKSSYKQYCKFIEGANLTEIEVAILLNSVINQILLFSNQFSEPFAVLTELNYIKLADIQTGLSRGDVSVEQVRTELSRI